MSLGVGTPRFKMTPIKAMNHFPIPQCRFASTLRNLVPLVSITDKVEGIDHFSIL
jgi:hypothetical protein